MTSLKTLSDEERLQEALPQVINELVVMTGRPVRLVWEAERSTAATDCVATVWINPRYFLGEDQSLGFGIIYHEGGHILHSPEGVELLKKAYKRGNAFELNGKPMPQGELMQHIVNILLDRKDDRLTANAKPGIAKTLRRRLTTICSLGFAESHKDEIGRYLDTLQKDREPSLKRAALIARDRRYARKLDPFEREKERLRVLGAVKAVTVSQDFFMAVKWGKRPRTPEGHRVRRYLNKHPITQETSHDQFLRIAERVIDILCDVPTEQDLDTLTKAQFRAKKERSEQRRKELTGQMGTQVALAQRLEHGQGGSKDPATQRLITLANKIIANMLKGARKRSVDGAIERIKSRTGTPGLGPTFRPPRVPLLTLKPDAKYATPYEKIRTGLLPEIRLLAEELKRLDSPTEHELYGQDEGDLDPSEAARIATGLPGIYTEIVEERHIDGEIALALDTSGSMGGEQLVQAKRVGVMFCEAILALGTSCDGRVWSYDSTRVCNLGRPSRTIAIPALEVHDCNSDTDMLGYVGKSMAKSRRRQKIILVVCDTGPDDAEEVRRISTELEARGIVVIHLLVGVHATPHIYPHEVLFATMEELVKEFGTLLRRIFKVLH